MKTLTQALAVQQRVVHALFLRELRTRFGKYRLGYFWAVLEPALHLAVNLLIFGYFMSRAMPTISFSVFLVNGIVPYMMATGIALRSLNAIEANQGLLSYRPVHPVDTILARALLETLIYAAVYTLLMVLLWLCGETVQVDNFPMLVGVWLMLALLGVGMGLIFMVLGHASPEMDKLLPIAIKPLYFVSGIMFSVQIIPAEYHWLVDWNPLLHAFELMRHAVFPAYPLYGISFVYLAGFTLCSLGLGLLLYKGREPAILRSS